jgi:superfamily I DNA and RNA helicase
MREKFKELHLTNNTSRIILTNFAEILCQVP